MKRFLEGPAATGKTTQALNQLDDWLQSGIAPHQIMVMVPQRTLGRPYQQFLLNSPIPNATSVPVVTFAGLAQRAISLYWTLIAPKIVPDWDGREPTFLNIETAQYYMARFVEPALHAGLFDGLSLARPRLVAQILDNLSKAAMNSFLLPEVVARLSAAWVGPSSRLRIYQTAFEVQQKFWDDCLQNARLDFSLQVEVFTNQLMPEPAYEQFARESQRYLIADNVEEHFPVVLDYLNWLWDSVEESVFIYDSDAGYRLFLGASPELAHELSVEVDQHESFTKPVDQDPALIGLTQAIDGAFPGTVIELDAEHNPTKGFTYQISSFYPQMIDWITDNVVSLVQSGVSPSQIVILAPFLNDSLRFSIFNRLDAAGVPYVSHRPSRAIRDEPVAQAVLTLMALAYPGWATMPQKTDLARALTQVIDGLDPIRADLLTQVVYRPDQLGSFDKIQQAMQSRITYSIGERYEALRLWLLDFRENASTVPPDHFMQRLFEYVAHAGYGFHTNLDAGRVVANLIDSAQRFREVVAPDGAEDWREVAHDYAQLVGSGVLSAVHGTDWMQESQDAVFVAPAYTFLMRNRLVDYQFWVDAGSNAWAERLDQPLTHPYVLKRDYPKMQQWTDEQEYEAQQAMLRRLLLGLVRRCRKQLYLGFADLGEQGFEQRGELLRIFNYMLQVYGNNAIS